MRLKLLLLFLAALSLRGFRLSAPFYGMSELDASGVFGQEFRNLHRYGWEGTMGWATRNPGRWAPGESPGFHLSHWPVALWAHVLLQKALGVGPELPEWSIRLLPVLCGALAPLLLFGIVRRIADEPRAWAAAWVSALLPSTVWFSQAVSCHFAFVYALVLGACLADLSGRGFWALLLAALAALSNWEGFYAFPLLAALRLLMRRDGAWRFALLAAAAGLLCAGALWAWSRTLPAERTILDWGRIRTESVPLAALWGKTAFRSLLYHTVPAVLAAFAALFLAGRGPWRTWILLWLVWALADVVLLGHYVFHHAYSVYAGFVFVSCGASEAWARLRPRLPRLALAAAALFALQSAWVLDRRATQLRGYPLTQDLVPSARARVRFGEDLLVAFKVETDMLGFYADALVVGDVASEADVLRAREAHPGRDFRWLVTVDPRAVDPLLEPSGTLGRFLPPALREWQGSASLERRREAFGVLPEGHPFLGWLEARYRPERDGPFTWWDLRPSSS